MTTPALVLRAATYQVRCDLCDKPQEQGQTDVITFFAGETEGEPVLKSMDVCRECRSRPIADLLAKLGGLGHVFGVRRNSGPVTG